MRQFHMSVGIDFLLRLEDSHLERILPALKNGQGGHPSISELRQFLTREQALGHKLLPLAECDNFDPVNGCGGHDMPDEA